MLRLVPVEISDDDALVRLVLQSGRKYGPVEYLPQKVPTVLVAAHCTS